MDDVDLDAGDPPPDLVLEADLPSSSLDELPIFARLGVAEVWRYAGGRLEILGPIGEGYERMSPQTWLFRRSPAAFWMPAAHVLCVGSQIGSRSEVVVVELQLQVVSLQVGQHKDARDGAGELPEAVKDVLCHERDALLELLAVDLSALPHPGALLPGTRCVDR